MGFCLALVASNPFLYILLILFFLILTWYPNLLGIVSFITSATLYLIFSSTDFLNLLCALSLF